MTAKTKLSEAQRRALAMIVRRGGDDGKVSILRSSYGGGDYVYPRLHVGSRKITPATIEALARRGMLAVRDGGDWRERHFEMTPAGREVAAEFEVERERAAKIAADVQARHAERLAKAEAHPVFITAEQVAWERFDMASKVLNGETFDAERVRAAEREYTTVLGVERVEPDLAGRIGRSLTHHAKMLMRDSSYASARSRGFLIESVAQAVIDPKEEG